MPGRYILVVDDDPVMVELITERLQAEGCLVTSAGDAEEAYIQAETLRPIVMFLDLRMPGFGTGGDVIRKMRRHPRLREIPIIVLTGMPPAEAKKMVPPDRLVRLMYKPPDWGLLLKTMRELIWAQRYPARSSGTAAPAQGAPPPGGAPPPPPPPKKTPPPSPPPAQQQVQHVLLVDDDQASVGFLTERLNAMGVQVESATYPEQAHSRADAVKPVLMVVELQLPSIAAGYLIDRLRENEHLRDIPILVLTRMSPSEANRFVVPERLVRVLHKPADWDLLLKTMRELLWAKRYPEQPAPAPSGTPPPSPAPGRTPPPSPAPGRTPPPSPAPSGTPPPSPAPSGTPPPSPAPGRTPPPKPAAKPPPRRGGVQPDKYILVVDDDPVIVELLSEHLKAMGCFVTSATDAEQAYIQAESIRPVLLILDLMMPGFGSGGDVIRKMRKHPQLRHTPILVLTGMPQAEAVKLVPPDRLVRLLYKPPDLALLVKSMRELLWAKRYPERSGQKPPS